MYAPQTSVRTEWGDWTVLKVDCFHLQDLGSSLESLKFWLCELVALEESEHSYLLHTGPPRYKHP